jgi:hypothetical protein
MPSETFVHPIECDPKENPFKIQYVRTGSLSASDNPLLYDLGTTWIATSGMQTDGQVLGDLWVTYEMELRKPVISSNVTQINQWHQVRVLTGLNSANPFGTSRADLGIPIMTSYSGNEVTCNPGISGTYMFTYTLQASGAISSCGLNVNSADFVNFTYSNRFISYASNWTSSSSGNSATVYAFLVVVDPTQICKFKINWGGTSTTGTLTAQVMAIRVDSQ